MDHSSCIVLRQVKKQNIHIMQPLSMVKTPKENISLPGASPDVDTPLHSDYSNKVHGEVTRAPSV